MDRPISRTKKTVLVFVLCALALQGIFCLFFTTRALETMFPLYVRAAAQKVVVGDNSYTEYFRLRNEAANSDVIVVGMDFTSPQTYALLEDMIVSLKHDANIGAVIIDAYGDAVSSEYAANAVNSVMPGEAELLCDEMREKYDVTSSYEEFLNRLSSINADFPPQKRLYGCSVENGDDHAEALLRTVHDAFVKSGRPVLLLTDSSRLAVDASFRVGAEDSEERYLFICCCYTNGVWDGVFSADESAVYLVERDDLHLFDRLYSVASTFSDGRRREYSYSETFSTEMFFVVTDGVETQESEGGEDNP